MTTDDLNEQYDLHLEDASGKETGAVIRILRAGSKPYLKTRDAQSTKHIEPIKGHGNRIIGYADRPPTYEELEDEALELIVACTVSWTGLELDCTPENARKVYADFPLIRTQVEDAVQSAHCGMEDFVAAGFYNFSAFSSAPRAQQKRRRYQGPTSNLRAATSLQSSAFLKMSSMTGKLATELYRRGATSPRNACWRSRMRVSETCCTAGGT